MRLVPFMAGIAGGIAIAAAGYTGYWFVAAGTIGERLGSWAEEQRALGVIVETGEPEVSGFPLRFDVVLTDPMIDDPAAGWGWRSHAITARIRPWNFSDITIFIDGQNDLRIFNGVAWRDIGWTIESGQAQLTLDDERRISDIALTFEDVTVSGLWTMGPAHVERLRARSLANRSDTSDQALDTVNAAFDMENIVLPEGLGEALGSHITYLTFDADLRGPLPDDTDMASIAAWRDAGGTLELNSLRLRWGPLGLESNGTIALDSEMRPMGALTARIIGYGDVIDALIESDLIPIGDAFLAKVAFNMLANEPPDGGPRVLEVPITAEDGGVFVGPVAIATVPPIERAEP